MIFTTNNSLKAWGRVLHDEDLAQAFIDRVLERGRIFRLEGPSVRTLQVNLDEAMTEDSDQEADVVIISGTHTTSGQPCAHRVHSAARRSRLRDRLVAATSPWFLLVGLVAGMLVGVYNLLATLRRR